MEKETEREEGGAQTDEANEGVAIKRLRSMKFQNLGGEKRIPSDESAQPSVL